MNTEQAPKLDNFLDFIKRLAEISVVLGAGLFLIGWSYLYGYCRTFGLSPDDLDFSIDSVLVHSIPVIWSKLFGIGAAAIFLLALVANYSRPINRWLGRPVLVFPLLLVAGLYVSKYAAGTGRDNARRDAYVSTSNLPFVTLEGSVDPNEVGCTLDEVNYRLLWRSKGRIFVILPIDAEPATGDADLRICSFPESRIQAMRIQVGLRAR